MRNARLAVGRDAEVALIRVPGHDGEGLLILLDGRIVVVAARIAHQLRHPQGALRCKPALLGPLNQGAQTTQGRGAYGAGRDDPSPLVQHRLIVWNLQ